MQNLKKIVYEKGKTLTWLAKELNVSRARITMMLNQDDMMLSTAFKIADLLGIDINEFRKEKSA